MIANELRIGNLVNAEIGLPYLSLHYMMAKDIENIEKGISKCYPIPLTEEWLLKFGFERKDYNWKKLSICNEWTYLYWEKSAGLELSVSNHFVKLSHIKYVNQLQNLCFALTGDELIIKE